MSLKIDDRTKTEVDTMQKMKDKVFISRMVETLTKLEIKYLAPRRNRKRRLFMRKQKNRPTIPKELASNYHVLPAPEPVESTVLETFPHVSSAIPIPESCPVLFCSPHRELYVDGDSPSIQCNNDSIKLQSLSEDLGYFANVPNPNVSSDETLPLGQGSTIYQSLVSSPSSPTARSSLTTDLLRELSREVVPPMPAAPLLPTLSPIRPSVTRCPAGTRDEQSIYNNLLQVDDVSLEPNDDVIDQVPIGNNSPTVTHKNYPIFFKFFEAVPSPGDGPVVLQDEEAVPVLPPLTLIVKTIPSAGCVELATSLLTSIVKKEKGAWLYGREGKMLGCPSFRPGRRETRRAPRRRWRTESAGVRQTHKFIVFQIVYRCLKMTG